MAGDVGAYRWRGPDGEEYVAVPVARLKLWHSALDTIKRFSIFDPRHRPRGRAALDLDNRNRYYGDLLKEMRDYTG